MIGHLHLGDAGEFLGCRHSYRSCIVSLISERQHQQNFQLIVITHDEDFLTRLSQSDALEQYWRVSRDEHLVRARPDRTLFLDPLTFCLPQHSIIERDVVHRL